MVQCQTHKFSLKEPREVDEAADSDDNEEIFKNSDVDILRPGLYPVLVRLTDSKVSEEEDPKVSHIYKATSQMQ